MNDKISLEKTSEPEDTNDKVANKLHQAIKDWGNTIHKWTVIWTIGITVMLIIVAFSTYRYWRIQRNVNNLTNQQIRTELYNVAPAPKRRNVRAYTNAKSDLNQINVLNRAYSENDIGSLKTINHQHPSNINSLVLKTALFMNIYYHQENVTFNHIHSIKPHDYDVLHTADIKSLNQRRLQILSNDITRILSDLPMKNKTVRTQYQALSPQVRYSIGIITNQQTFKN